MQKEEEERKEEEEEDLRHTAERCFNKIMRVWFNARRNLSPNREYPFVYNLQAKLS